MTSLRVCRLIVDAPAPGPWNMAVDEVLLSAAADEGVATLRFYRWSEPTLSLGYFQRYEDRWQHAASQEAAIVRRQTGGGAILHDRELTYSLALPATHPLARDNQRLYTAVHQAVIDLLAPQLSTAGPQNALQLQAAVLRPPATGDSFLCFERRALSDVLLVASAPAAEAAAAGDGGWKILGSAQRRRRGAILQHGSLLLARSPAAPELLGLCDLTPVEIGFDDLASRLPRILAGRLQLNPQRTKLSSQSGETARIMVGARYGHSGWTKRR